MKKEFKTERERIAYNCRKATFLIEKKQEETLTKSENLELNLHLAGCHICRIYERQSALIDLMIKKIFSANKKDIKLEGSYKLELQKRIDEETIRNA